MGSHPLFFSELLFVLFFIRNLNPKKEFANDQTDIKPKPLLRLLGTTTGSGSASSSGRQERVFIPWLASKKGKRPIKRSEALMHHVLLNDNSNTRSPRVGHVAGSSLEVLRRCGLSAFSTWGKCHQKWGSKMEAYYAAIVIKKKSSCL